MKQKSLFGNLPTIDDKAKEINKKIISKANSPTKSKTKTVRGRAGADKKTQLRNKVTAIVEASKEKMESQSHLYECIRTEERFREYMQKIRDVGSASLDVETIGLDIINDWIVGIVLHVEGEKSAYIPMWHTDFDDNRLPDQIDYELATAELEKSLDINWRFHNADFDIRSVKRWLNLSKYPHVAWDTMLGSNYLNENEPHGLKYLWNKYINRDAEVEAEKFGKLFDKVPFNYIPIEPIATVYAAKDGDMTTSLTRFQEQFLRPERQSCKDKGLYEAGKFFTEVEVPLIKVIAEMEDAGVTIDENKSKELSELYTRRLYDADMKLQSIVKKLNLSNLSNEKREKLSSGVNYNSPQQVQILLYDVLQLKSPDKRSPRGTGEDILVSLGDRYSEHKEIFDAILECRGLKKLLGTYIDKMPKIVKEKTGKLHGSFNQYGAKTGRFSSSNPNLQNIPSKNKEIRKMFTASEGYYLIGGDFSQQEPRVLAHLLSVLFNDESMKDAYLEGKDLYSWMAAKVYNKPYENCMEFHPETGELQKEGKQLRTSVKSIVLGLMYGRSTASIAEQLGTSKEQAQKYTDLLFETFPGIRDVVEHYKKMAKNNGFVQTAYGVKRRLPDYNLSKWKFVSMKDKKTPIEDDTVCQYYRTRLENMMGKWQKNEIWEDANSKGVWIIDNRMKISEAERQILNSVIQGSSANITKKAMLEIAKDKKLKELGFRQLLTVHDEIIGEAPKQHAKEAADRLCEIMISSVEDKISVPMKVDAEIMNEWYGEDLYDSIS